MNISQLITANENRIKQVKAALIVLGVVGVVWVLIITWALWPIKFVEYGDTQIKRGVDPVWLILGAIVLVIICVLVAAWFTRQRQLIARNNARAQASITRRQREIQQQRFAGY